MAKFKQLRDLDRFPGFIPSRHLRGRFGDPMAVVIALRRHRKKRSVESAVMVPSATTTSGHARSAISPPATNAFISRSGSEEFPARGVRA